MACKSRCLSGHSHPSKSEAEYCNWLLARKQSGEIIDYDYIATVDLHVNGKLWRKWKIDFSVTELDGTVSYHECKGYNLSDESFKLKLSAFRLEYPEIKLYVNKMLVEKNRWSRRDEKNYFKSKKSLLDRQCRRRKNKK